MKRKSLLLWFLLGALASSELAAAAPLSQEPTRALYQVYVETFRDGTIGRARPAGSGNFDGLRDSMRYLRDLGVGALLVMPIFDSDGMGYIPNDFFSIRKDYALGATDAERDRNFRLFADAAHAAGIKIILDAPINHISRQSKWYLGSAARDGIHDNWFLWSPEPLPGWRRPWQSDGKPADVWHLDKTRGEYFYALFSDSMPDLNHQNPEVVATFNRFFEKYASLGADGFRIDAAKHLVETTTNLDPTLPENMATLRGYLTTLRSRYPDQTFLLEIWSGYDMIDPYLPDTSDMALDFPYMERLRDSLQGNHPYGVRLSLEHFERTQARIPAASRVLFMGNHDVPRIRNHVQNESERVELAMALTLSLPQTPLLYYGDEIFMPGTYVRDENGWTKTNEVCSPMAWTSGPNAGFTDPAVTLPDSWNRTLHRDWREFNVEVQSQRPDSILNLVKATLAMRKILPLDARSRIHLGNQDKSDYILTVATTLSDGSCTVGLYNFGRHTEYNRSASMPGICEEGPGSQVLLSRRTEPRGRTVNVAGRGFHWVRHFPRVGASR